MIRKAAARIKDAFPDKTYRMGGDEFVAVEDQMDEAAFRAAVAEICQSLAQEDVSVSVGLSWRDRDCAIQEQLDEADLRMYQAKAAFYSSRDTDRRQK